MKLPANDLVTIEDINVEYQKFFTVSLDMLCISSYDGHFKKVNPAFEEVLGFSAEELCTKSYLDFIHPDDIERTTKEVEKQLLTKQQVLSFENRYLCKDGSYKWLSWKSAPVGNFMYAAARDITNEKASNEELKRAKNELELFSSSVAHDLRAPIRSILGFSTMILEDSHSSLGTEAKNYLGRVINASKKMGILIDGLLNLSRLARKELNKENTNLSAAVKELAEELQSLNPERKVSFIIADSAFVNGDPVLLRAVIENLIGNAWKYSSKCKRDITIEFGFFDKNDERIYFVRDDGEGFDMKYVHKLFGVFQRLHSEDEFAGNGIGLATTHRIIDRHGGKIWAESVLGQSATFYFTL